MASPVDLVTAEQLPASVRGAVEAVRLPLLITAASEAVAAHVGYPLHQRLGVVESAVGRGRQYLWLRSGGVRQVHRVEVRGEVRAPSTYALESAVHGRLVARGQPWPFTGTWTTGISSTPLEAQDTGEVLVTFDAGWVTPGQRALDASLVVGLPAALQLAAVEVVTAAVSRDGRPGDMAGESIGDTSASYAVGEDGGRLALPASARQFAAPYRRRR
ncbi:hypothetical protein JY651_28745 [Pyxidicoccus parkwayensis]|uniref:Uncharacterized protein n=1 Tax=Pyxidicoccus parkwayensis TaxID=2813578 RepID=A0ABX7NPK1_9BACT|nr:hypothetical protein [Pyxidicoccus parkwaysis]QSQ19321.1 hypothetical protein JY651_28745 [Pyxidicoccus parkwaysis]